MQQVVVFDSVFFSDIRGVDMQINGTNFGMRFVLNTV
jgi:hypothetical protein